MLAIVSSTKKLENPALSFKERCTQHIESIFQSCRQWSASIQTQEDIPFKTGISMVFSLYRQWDTWNHHVDRAADHAVRFFARFIPCSKRIIHEHNTQAKVIALWLSLATLWQTSELISIAKLAGRIGMVSIACPTLFLTGLHIHACLQEFSSEDIGENAVVMSFLLAMQLAIIQHARPHVLPTFIWSSVALIGVSILVSSRFFTQCRRSQQDMGFAQIREEGIPLSIKERGEKIFRRMFNWPRRLSINENAKRQCPIIALEIKRLQSLIKRLDAFINNQPALRDLVLKTIQEHAYARSNYSSERVKNSLNDPLKKMFALRRHCRDLQFELNTRKRFIQRHEVITDWLNNHLSQTTAENLAEFQNILSEWVALEDLMESIIQPR